MSPTVTAAIIAAGVGVITVITTVLTQFLGRRATSRDTQKALEAQSEHLDRTLEAQSEHLGRTLEAQSEQLDRTLAEQRTRTLNERFATATEQVGSDRPAVRLAGMYAMAGLADEWEENRQTIVNIICAYLRMPFSSTAPTGKFDPDQDFGDLDADEGTGDVWRQERQVRLTAQRILAEHLREGTSFEDEENFAHPPIPRFWPDVWLDLAGATLIDFNVNGGVVNYADFRAATFGGETWFSGTTFSGYAEFEGATFSGDVHFIGTNFRIGTKFQNATFSGDADFNLASFRGSAWFNGAYFSREANFGSATFDSLHVAFGSATFGGKVVFDRATFTDRSTLHLEGLRVLSPKAEHVWPAGWRLEGDDNVGYPVRCATDGAS
jgi:hypothetical protein